MQPNSIKIRLYSYDSRILDAAAQTIVERAINTGAKISGPFPLPVDITRVTVNRSPHVDKKSREHFERRTYKRLIVLAHSNPQTVEALMKMELPTGVEVKLMVKEQNSGV